MSIYKFNRKDVTLFIDTTKNHSIKVDLKNNSKIIDRKIISAPYAEAEKLLSLIEGILKENNLGLKDIKKIKVSNKGGSFTGLRIGVVTANALGYALGVPVEGRDEALPRLYGGRAKFDIVNPIYDREPNITKSKK